MVKTVYRIQPDCILMFYKKPGDNKYSFLIVDEPDLTDWLLSKCKTKRVNACNIKYAVSGITEKLTPLFDAIKIGENAEKETNNNLKFAFEILRDYQHELFVAVRSEIDERYLGFSKNK